VADIEDCLGSVEQMTVYKIAVIGLGRLGISLVEYLAGTGVQVIAMDSDPALVDEVKDLVDIAVCLDSTDQDALTSQRVQEVDVCVIAIGENFQAALLTTVIVKKMGIPRIICRAQTSTHAEIFSRIGADEIIQPESQAGVLLGRRLANPKLHQFVELAEGYSLIEMGAPSTFWGKTLEQLALRTKYQVNLIAFKRQVNTKEKDDNKTSVEKMIVPGPQDILREGDVLLLVGADEHLARLPQE